MVDTNIASFESQLLRASERTGTDNSLFRADGLECRFSAAFDHIETGAPLVLVGITPGAVQHANASRTLETELAAGLPSAVAARRAKYAGSFSGPLRRNLVAMLDYVGAHRALGLNSCAEMFAPDRRGLVHFTSALRHPVFLNGANYTARRTCSARRRCVA